MRTAAQIAQFHHIFLLGVAIKLGGCVAAWHNGYIVGVWGYFIACFIVGTGYMCLNLCVAEMTSVTSFPGGHFGYVRASIGPFWGYMAGMMSILESTFFLAVSILKLGQACTITFGTRSEYEFLWWFIAYSVMMGFHVRGGMTLWRFMSLSTVITVVTLFIYLFGFIPAMNIPRYAYGNSDTGIVDDALDFFLVLRLPSWLFVGIDLLPLTSEEVHNATTNIPRAIVAVMMSMFVVSIWLQMAVAGQEPGLIPEFFGLHNVFPLSPGFGKIFGIGTRWGTAFSILPCFTSCFSFMFVSSRQIHAMSRSGLLPEVFSITHGAHGTPVAAMVVVTLVGLISLPFAWVYDPHTLLFRMAVSGSCVTYVLVLLAFVQFRTTYSHMARTFRNPLGIASAAYGILVFAVEELSVLFILAVQVNFHQTIAFSCILVAAVLYYYLVARYHQTFSPEEQDTFLRTYVVNANMAAKKRHRQGIHSPLPGGGAGAGGWLSSLSYMKIPLPTGSYSGSRPSSSAVAVTTTDAVSAEIATVERAGQHVDDEEQGGHSTSVSEAMARRRQRDGEGGTADGNVQEELRLQSTSSEPPPPLMMLPPV